MASAKDYERLERRVRGGASLADLAEREGVTRQAISYSVLRASRERGRILAEQLTRYGSVMIAEIEDSDPLGGVNELAWTIGLLRDQGLRVRAIFRSGANSTHVELKEL